jgi:hypothetical protein
MKNGIWTLTGEEVILVHPHSATDSLPSKTINSTQAIQRNHSEMVKFSMNDTNYQQVMHHLVPLAEDAVDVIRTRFVPNKGISLS